MCPFYWAAFFRLRVLQQQHALYPTSGGIIPSVCVRFKIIMAVGKLSWSNKGQRQLSCTCFVNITSCFYL